MVRYNVYPSEEWVVTEQYKEIIGNLKRDLFDAVENELAEELMNAIRDSVYARVYQRYTPTLYARRGDMHGLSDTSQYVEIVYNSSDVAGSSASSLLEVMLPFTTESGEDLVSVIETANGYSWVNSRIYREHIKRPFLQEAAQDIIRDRSALAALAEGLTRQGWNIKNPYVRKHTPQRKHKSPNHKRTVSAWENYMEREVYENGYGSSDF